MNTNFLEKYVLLEKSIDRVNVIGLYSYHEAISKRDQLECTSSRISSYEIQGPFKISLPNNPPSLFPPINEPRVPFINSPKFTKRNFFD